MPTPTKYWIVLPPADKLATVSPASLTLTVHTSEEAANSAAQREAVIKNEPRVVLEAMSYANSTVTAVMHDVDPAP